MNLSDLVAVAAVGGIPVASVAGMLRQRRGPPLPGTRGAAAAWGRGRAQAVGGPRRPAPRSDSGLIGARLPRLPRPETGARWAARSDLQVLRAPAENHPGRLVLGAAPAGNLVPRRVTVLAAEAAQSVAVVGPTQSGKTTALAVPAILGWAGPVLAASVKTDLVRDTIEWRRQCGSVWCFDPAGTTGLPRSSWSPLAAARTWPGARRLAADLTEVTRSEGTSADGEFWYATAAKLLAPLLFAAAAGRRSMHDVVRWVDVQETEEVENLLRAAGSPEALQAARATWLRDERQRSAVYTTAETVLEPFADAPLPTPYPQAGTGPDGAWRDTPPYGVPLRGPGPDRGPEAGGIDGEALVTGAHTLYVCAPAHDQRRLRGLFVALIQQVLHAAFALSARMGRPLDPPLLVVLDEAANIAPLRDLDGLAATCAGHGVQLVTVWQDLAQVRARYGERGATVVNNHRAKLFLPGIADPATLEFASQLAGTEDRPTPSVTYGSRGERTVTTAPTLRRLLPADALRRLPAGTAVLLYGSLPPARIRLRPWFRDPVLARRSQAAHGQVRAALGSPGGARYSRGT